MYIINGLKLAQQFKSELKEKVKTLQSPPNFVIIYAGYNDASQIYVDKKIQTAKEIGVNSELIRLKETTTEELIALIKRLNEDNAVDGYILQLPLPKNVDTREVLVHVDPKKDIDGLSPISLGLLYHKQPAFVSATALAVVEVIKYAARYADNQYTENEVPMADEDLLEGFLKSKNILIISHSILVGKPLNGILLNYGGTVTVAHQYTDKGFLATLIKNSDIVISATGVPGIINSDMVRDGQLLIDVGINKSALGISGDIDIKGMEGKNLWVTPVPDGVGPLTVIMLLKNVVQAAQKV